MPAETVAEAEWATWETERLARNRENDMAQANTQRCREVASIPAWTDRLFDAQVAVFLWQEAFAAMLQLWREAREQLAFEQALLVDVLREARG